MTGPSSSQSSYLVPNQPGIRFSAIVTAGDTINADGDVFAGIPDGLGAFDNNDGTFTVLVNHEIRGGEGLVRDHGANGAFVTRLVIDKDSLAVVDGGDLIQTVQLWNDATESFLPSVTTFSRFCSADLPVWSAFYNSATGLGTDARIFMTGEETGPEGRAFGIVVTGDEAGTAYELAYLGLFSWENSVASPFEQDKTIVIGTDDATPGQVYIYVGEKQAEGNAVEKAGLVGGALYGIAVDGIGNEQGGTLTPDLGARFSLVAVGDNGDASASTGAALDAQSDALGVTEFLRPEDGQWDPNSPNDFYFVTTTAPSRLIKLSFDDITDPTAGGSVEVVLDERDWIDPAVSLDNMTIGQDGLIWLQEDPGSSGRLARVWAYDTNEGLLFQIAEHDPLRFAPGAPEFLTQNEESSGIIDVSHILADGFSQAFLVDVQAHFATGNPATVEGGQLLAMFIDSAIGDEGDNEIRGTDGNDDLIGGGGADMFIFDNNTATGLDTIRDFGADDCILVTEMLFDSNNDGRIDFGRDRALDLFRQDQDEVKVIGENGRTITTVYLAGTETVDGVDYFKYTLLAPVADLA